MMSNYHDELVCDMAETYRIFDIKRVPASLAATLAVGLRDDSRVKQAKSGANDRQRVSDNTLMLAYIVDLLRGVGIDDDASLRRWYMTPQQERDETEHEIFDSPEAYRARWKEVTRN